MFDSSIRNRILLAALVPLVLAVASMGVFLLTRHTQDIERHHIERSISLARQAAHSRRAAIGYRLPANGAAGGNVH